MPLSVIIFEDNTVLRESIGSFLSLNDNYKLNGLFENAIAVEEKVKSIKPGLVLMDIDMPGRTGIEAVRLIRLFQPNLPILMLTVFDDSSHVLEAIKAGASGYLLKRDISKRLFTAIEEIMDGGAPMSASVAKLVINSMQTNNAKDNYQLTMREREILNELSKGNSYKLIASNFQLSIDTIRTHIKNIYDKLHVHSKTEAVLKALGENLL